jgi:hypothetical protein
VRELQIPQIPELIERYGRKWEEHAEGNLKSSDYIKQQEKTCGKHLNL